MVDRRLGRDIRRLVEESVPPAPWLDDRIMAAVNDARFGVEARPTPASARWRAVSLAAPMIGILVVVALIASRVASPTAPAPGSHAVPTSDDTVVAYRTLIAQDMYVVDSFFMKSAACKTREACVSKLTQTRTATETLLQDLSTTPVPSALTPAVAQMKAAADQFKAELDVAIALMEQPNSDYVGALATPTIHDLDLAAGGLDCWPVKAVDGDHGVACSSG